MILKIDQMSPEPLYLQIRSQIVAAIACGELVPGDHLPSVRALASDLGINLHTVNKAYAVLRDEGYLVMKGRSGALVADAAQQALAPKHTHAEEAIVRALKSLALEVRARGGSKQDFLEIAAHQADLVFGAAPDAPVPDAPAAPAPDAPAPDTTHSTPER